MSDSERQTAWVDLSHYTTGAYDPGRGIVVRLVWYLTSLLLFESGWFLWTGAKPSILRLFGAKIGQGVVIKPNVRIKYPWWLEVGDHCWIGQEAWIDNFVPVRLGDHVCVSQRVYLCTGSHDYRRRSFDLVPGEIVLGSGCWIAAGALLTGGATVGANAVVAAGAVVTGEVPPETIVGGVPAQPIGMREKPSGEAQQG